MNKITDIIMMFMITFITLYLYDGILINAINGLNPVEYYSNIALMCKHYFISVMDYIY